MHQNIDRPGAQSSDVGTILPSGLQLGLGVQISSVYRIHEQGAMQITENPLDLAINGDGFFQIQMPDGQTAYSRSGVFQLNENGEMVTTEGFLIEPSIVVPTDATAVEVNQSGEVFVSQDGVVNMTNVGQIQLANFVNPAGLEAIGDNLFIDHFVSTLCRYKIGNFFNDINVRVFNCPLADRAEIRCNSR